MNISVHAGILVKRIDCIVRLECFLQYKISGDFEWMLAFVKYQNLSFDFPNEIIYRMKPGGISNSGYFSELTKLVEVQES